MEAVERIASTDPALASTPSAFDKDPMLLNTREGVIDLETGEVGPNRSSLMMTAVAGASARGEAPRWRRFLDEVTDGDGDMQSYLQRVAGYCLSGSVREQVFFFLHGHGANGKSIFVGALKDALGDYGLTASFETFAASKYPNHPTELAGLRGARLVLVTETERNRGLAESRIKAITGGDPIAARFMRADFFEYRPTFKLMFAGNHRPALASFGEAMRRRLHLIPFDVTIPRERREADLSDRLRDELDGILAWMVAGSAIWRREGLSPPDRIRSAVDDYFAEEDLVGQWIDERCVQGPDLTASSTELFADWRGFAELNGRQPGSMRSLSEELKKRGYEPVRTAQSRGWAGIGLLRSGAWQ